MAKSVGMFQRPVEFKMPKLWEVQDFYFLPIGQTRTGITSISLIANKTIELYIGSNLHTGLEYNLAFAFLVKSVHDDLDTRFNKIINGLKSFQKAILEEDYVLENEYVFAETDNDDSYRDFFTLVYPSIIDQIIGSVSANESVIKNSDFFEWVL